MKNIFFLFLILFAFINSSNIFAMDTDEFSDEDRLAIAIALSQDACVTLPPRDFASEDLVRRMVAEEARKKQAEDEATAALIRRMTLEDRRATYCSTMDEATAALIAEMLEEKPTPSLAVAAPAANRFHGDPIFHIVRTHKDVAIHRATLGSIVVLLERISQGDDVHVLDGHVVANLERLHTIGDAFGVDTPTLTAAEMRTYLLSCCDSYKEYEGHAVTKMQLNGYIGAVLTTASEQTSTLRMYSRVVSLIQHLGTRDQAMYLKRLLDAISENYLTQGGCFQGVRNRIYIRYVDMMNNLIGK